MSGANKAEIILTGLTKRVNSLKTLKLGTDKKSLIAFEQTFEVLQQAILVASIALRCQETAEGEENYNEAIFTVNRIFKEALFDADRFFLTFIQRKISSASGQLGQGVKQIMSAGGVCETIPTPFDICFASYSDILIETNQFLEKYEDFFTEERFAGYLKKFDKSSTTHENRVEESKKLCPRLDSFIVKLTALCDRMIGFNQLLNHGNGNLLKSLNFNNGDAAALAAGLKAIPVLIRLMKADDRIENYMAQAPEASGCWGKFNISQLHEIDTRLTVLVTRLCIFVVNVMVSNMQ